MAKGAGIEGFAYWHYWWAGKRLIERPINEVLKTGKPNFPFCFSWANETWSGIWIGNPHKVLMEQTYPGEDDYKKHFYTILEALHDPRYIKVEGKPLFILYKPLNIPDARKYIDLWNNLAIKNGLAGIYFVGMVTLPHKEVNKVLDLGFNAVNTLGFYESCEHIEGRFKHKVKMYLLNKVGGIILNRYDYKDVIKYMFSDFDLFENVYPTILPQWDNSARSGRRSVIIFNSTPELFNKHVKEAIELIKNKEEQHKILFLKSWNEWAEGNYVEPDLKFGHGYLKALKSNLF